MLILKSLLKHNKEAKAGGIWSYMVTVKTTQNQSRASEPQFVETSSNNSFYLFIKHEAFTFRVGVRVRRPEYYHLCFMLIQVQNSLHSFIHLRGR